MVLPLLSQKVVLMPSPRLRTVRLRTSKVWVTHMRWRRLPASSKSEFAMVLLGLSAAANQSLIHCGHCNHEMMGSWEDQPSLAST